MGGTGTGGIMARCMAGLARARPEPAIALARPPEGWMRRGAVLERVGFFSDGFRCQVEDFFFSVESGSGFGGELTLSSVGDETMGCCWWRTDTGDDAVLIEIFACDVELRRDRDSDGLSFKLLVDSGVGGADGYDCDGLRGPGVRSSGSGPSPTLGPTESARCVVSFIRSANAFLALPASSSLYVADVVCARRWSGAGMGIESLRRGLPGVTGPFSSDSEDSDVRVIRGLSVGRPARPASLAVYILRCPDPFCLSMSDCEPLLWPDFVNLENMDGMVAVCIKNRPFRSDEEFNKKTLLFPQWGKRGPHKQTTTTSTTKIGRWAELK